MLAIETKTNTCMLRPARREDDEFLFRLFAESQDQLSAFLADEPLWRSLVEIQYRGRMVTYAEEYPESIDSIICLEDEAGIEMPVGRLLVDRRQDCWRIVDVAVLAAYRGRGWGTWALSQCQRQCGAVAAKLLLRVHPENRARCLYERLGFHATSEDPLAAEMVWNAASYGVRDEGSE